MSFFIKSPQIFYQISTSYGVHIKSLGLYVISKTGLDVVTKNLDSINTDFLKSINPEFKIRIEGHGKNKDEKQKVFAPADEEMNPRELIFDGARKYKETKKDECFLF